MDEIVKLVEKGYTISFKQDIDDEHIHIKMSKGFGCWNFIILSKEIVELDYVFPLIIKEGIEKIETALLKGQLPEDV